MARPAITCKARFSTPILSTYSCDSGAFLGKRCFWASRESVGPDEMSAGTEGADAREGDFLGAGAGDSSSEDSSSEDSSSEVSSSEVSSSEVSSSEDSHRWRHEIRHLRGTLPSWVPALSQAAPSPHSPHSPP